MRSQHRSVHVLEIELEKAHALRIEKQTALNDNEVAAALEALNQAKAELERLSAHSDLIPHGTEQEAMETLIDRQKAWFKDIRSLVPDSIQSSIDEAEAALLGRPAQQGSIPDLEALPTPDRFTQNYDWTQLVESAHRFEADVRAQALADSPAQVIEAQIRVESTNSHYMKILALRQAEYNAALAVCEDLEQSLAQAIENARQGPGQARPE